MSPQIFENPTKKTKIEKLDREGNRKKEKRNSHKKKGEFHIKEYRLEAPCQWQVALPMADSVWIKKNGKASSRCPGFVSTSLLVVLQYVEYHDRDSERSSAAERSGTREAHLNRSAN